ncbi:MAG: PQQ-binding-like beta-propeller repeat protein [Mariniblastus sp.]
MNFFDNIRVVFFCGLFATVCLNQSVSFATQTSDQEKSATDDAAAAPVVPGLVVDDETTVKNLTNETYWRAARNGDLETVKAALKSGIEVDVKTDYGATALFFACDRGQEEVVKLLLEKGADPNSKDKFYNSTPTSWAQMKPNKKIIAMLLANGGEGSDAILMNAVLSNDAEFAKTIIDSKAVSEEGLIKARDASLRNLDALDKAESEKAKDGEDTQAETAKEENARKEAKEKAASLVAVFDELDLPDPIPPIELDAETLNRYVGEFKSERFGVEFFAGDKKLQMNFDGGEKMDLVAVKENEFSLNGSNLTFEMDGETVKLARLESGPREFVLTPVSKTETDLPPQPTIAETKPNSSGEPADSSSTKTAKNETATPEPVELGPSDINSLWADLSISSENWPGFRGNGSRGIAEGQNPPTEWNVIAQPAETESTNEESSTDESETAKEAETNVNLKWKTPVPGLGLSCPSIWGDKIYVTSAVSKEKGDGGKLKIGLYGDVDSVEEDKEYHFKVFCYDKNDGTLLWEKTANTAKPAVKRHAKSSHANPTVATDGKNVVAFFGSEGLYNYNADGELKWSKDFGLLDSGWFYDPGYQWGFASSPVIYGDKVIVQCDIQGQSFITAIDLETGNEVWRTDRAEIPTWSTPTVYDFGDREKKWDRRPMVITNGTKAARGYDLKTGKQLWQVRDNSEIVVPTPFVAHNLIFIASGYSPIQPIYAIKPEARGDISPGENNTTNESIPWSVKRGGPYMPTPIVYGDYLYSCANNGILTCYVAKTGREVYKKRMRVPGGALSFTASPVAGDGHVYLTAEDGRVIVLKAGPEFEIVRTNHCNESILATPAISAGTMFFRTQDSLIAVGE